MTNKKTVLVAESSKIVIKLLQKTLDCEKYNIIFSSDGFEALSKILEIKPDCVVANKVLTTIDGIQLCSIIKMGYEISDISFILYSYDDEKSDFWSANSYANDFINLTSENIEELNHHIDNLQVENKVNVSSFLENSVDGYKDKEIALYSARALEKIDFYTNLLKRIINLTYSLEDIDELVERIFGLIYEISLFDAAVIILNDKKHILYSTGLGNLQEEASSRFVEICKAEYEDVLHSSNSIDYDFIDIEGIVDFSDEEKNYASYMMFPIGSSEIVGTIHLVSEKKQHFNYKVQSSIQLLTKNIDNIIQNSLLQRRISVSEAKLRTAFSKFVPEEIIDDLLLKNEESGTETNNEKRKVAVLICDIRNFTTISEINQPENVVGFLNGYFSLMVDIIKNNGGSIDKFMGDAIMALFGAPISYVDNARRAVKAAMEMELALEKVDTSIISFPEGMNFDIGIGIHYGEVIVGNIGSKEKTEYTVIGDTVNLTSRIEGLTKQYGTRIMISQAVKDELDENFHVMQLDKVRVKGKLQGVQMYRVDNKVLPEEYTTNYEKGLKLYMNGAWTLALSYFKNALQVFPNDKAATLMHKRCEEFIENPPADWNGAIALTSK